MESGGKNAFCLKDICEFQPKTITQLYGPPASGKTNVCLCALVDCVRSGKKAIFIDTDGSFSTERVRQISKDDFAKVMKNVIIAEPADFDEQKIAINKIEDLLSEKDIGLIIVDSLVSLYRLELGTTKDYQSLNKEMTKQLAKLLNMARKYEIPVIVTNQVYKTFEEDMRDKKVVPIGREMLNYWTKNIVELQKPRKGERLARLIRHNCKPEGGKFVFRIRDAGLKDGWGG
jgi:DNA repair protein RadB